MRAGSFISASICYYFLSIPAYGAWYNKKV